MFTPSKTIKNLAFIFGAVTLSLGLGYAVLAVWQEPLLSPPDGNIDAPLNAGPDGQEKVGGLILGTNCVGPCKNGLIVDKGNVGIGTTNPTTGKLVVSGGNIDMTNNKITNVQTPTNNLDAVNKAYVDALGGGGGGNNGVDAYGYNWMYVYTTTKTYDGNLGGLAGADSKCAADRPSEVPDGLIYKAYLCDDNTCQKMHRTKPNTIVVGSSDIFGYNDTTRLINYLEPVSGGSGSSSTYDPAWRFDSTATTTINNRPSNMLEKNDLKFGLSGYILDKSLQQLSIGTKDRKYYWTGAQESAGYSNAYNVGTLYDFAPYPGYNCNGWTSNAAGNASPGHWVLQKVPGKPNTWENIWVPASGGPFVSLGDTEARAVDKGFARAVSDTTCDSLNSILCWAE